MTPTTPTHEEDFSAAQDRQTAGAQVASHTPGPWRIKMDPYPHVRTAETNACVFASDLASDADCALIAAAPELLEAAISAFYALVGAQIAHEVSKNGWEWPDTASATVSVTAEKLRAAIAKALGHTPQSPEAENSEPGITS